MKYNTLRAHLSSQDSILNH